MRILPVILGVIPGIGHISFGRCFKGVAIFLFFALFVNLVVIGRLILWLDGGEDIVQAGLLCALIIWVYAFLDIVKIAVWNKRPWIRTLKKELFTGGIRHYLRGEFEDARRKFRKVLRLDDEDVDAHFLLGVISRRMGRFRSAGHSFRRALALDPDGPHLAKWKWEVSEHRREMEEARKK